jgi:hypothetical protein
MSKRLKLSSNRYSKKVIKTSQGAHTRFQIPYELRSNIITPNRLPRLLTWIVAAIARNRSVNAEYTLGGSGLNKALLNWCVEYRQPGRGEYRFFSSTPLAIERRAMCYLSLLSFITTVTMFIASVTNQGMMVGITFGPFIYIIFRVVAPSLYREPIAVSIAHWCICTVCLIFAVPGFIHKLRTLH